MKKYALVILFSICAFVRLASSNGILESEKSKNLWSVGLHLTVFEETVLSDRTRELVADIWNRSSDEEKCTFLTTVKTCELYEEYPSLYYMWQKVGKTFLLDDYHENFNRSKNFTMHRRILNNKIKGPFTYICKDANIAIEKYVENYCIMNPNSTLSEFLLDLHNVDYDRRKSLFKIHEGFSHLEKIYVQPMQKKYDPRDLPKKLSAPLEELD